ncbi:hypothetical protein HRbin01_01493 [archaeon HR01]|nr:hypothetical protein HRbin01_01493 [archaeon HR01]
MRVLLLALAAILLGLALTIIGGGGWTGIIIIGPFPIVISDGGQPHALLAALIILAALLSFLFLLRR